MAQSGKTLSSWHSLIDEFSTSSMDFYEAVEEAVRSREVPDAAFSRVEFKEGGFASARRVYLRVERDRVAFDLCAAPYGTGFFFSWWLTRLGPRHAFLYILGFLILPLVVPPVFLAPLLVLLAIGQEGFAFLVLMVGLPVGSVGVVVGLAILARKEVFGPEEDILALPVLGWVYDKIFSPITYYSIDTALMFQESVRRAVNDVIDELLDEKGLRALTADQRKPTIRDLAR